MNFRALALGAVIVGGIGIWWSGRDATGSSADNTPFALTSTALAGPPTAPAFTDFAGSASCEQCHAAQFAVWRSSTHGQAGGVPTPRGANSRAADGVDVIAPFDGTPIRFRDAVVIPTQANGVFSFVVRRPNERDTSYVVSAVIGGGHMEGGGTQGFVTNWFDGTVRFLPFDWSKHSRTWFCHTGTRLGQGWVPISPSLRLADCGDWPPSRVLGDEPRFSNCQSCHGSQIALSFDSTQKQWTTQTNGFAINCESCHGPAARHVTLMSSGAPPTADIGLVALSTLNTDQSVNTCMACHALKVRLASGFQPGAELSQFYSVRLSQLGERPFTADGRTRTFAYQDGHLASDCYRNGNMTCTSCHDPHSQQYRTVTGDALRGRTDDRQCTSCHASKADNVGAHTKHRENSVGSRCVSCHMSYQQQLELGPKIRYARSDHSIAIPRPATDSTLGIASACRTCHATMSESRLAEQSAQWWGEFKPYEAAVAGVLSARTASNIAVASPLLLHPQSRNATAQVAGLTEWIETFAMPSMDALPGSTEQALRALAVNADIDVRSLGLAALHFSRGHNPDVRKFLQRQLAGVRGDSAMYYASLRRRWMTVLGGIGDAARSASDYPRALTAYRKALEVVPDEPTVLVNEGLALAGQRNPLAAILAYRKSLRINAAQPMAEVNLGIALEQTGDVAEAASAYMRAIAIDPTAAPAYLNMGTLYLRQENATDAIPFFGKGLMRDPGAAVGHFQLALAYLKAGDLVSAESSVVRSIAMDSSNAEAHKLLAALKEARTRQ